MSRTEVRDHPCQGGEQDTEAQSLKQQQKQGVTGSQSDSYTDLPKETKGFEPDPKQKPRKGSTVSRHSLARSDTSIDDPPEFNKEPTPRDQETELSSDLEEKILMFVKDELKKVQKLLKKDEKGWMESQRACQDVMGGKDDDQRWNSRESFLNITMNILKEMNREELADTLEIGTKVPLCQQKLKSSLKQKFQCLCEETGEAENKTRLSQIYTELHMTEGGTGQITDEIEQTETASRKPDRAEATIRQEDVFKGPAGRERPIRTVVTKGAAGIGKTVLIQKFMLDWAEGKANQDIDFIFPITFRELNVLKEERFSLVELVHRFFPETKAADFCKFDQFQVVIILDALDECCLPLDFHSTKVLSDVTESTSVDVLLTNIIRGKLLPSARLWITSRPAEAKNIPTECIDMETEVKGFTDPQKDEYFRKRFTDEQQATTIISHIKASQSLHFMCHIPVFCWITATVLEDLLRTREGGMTLTWIYIHFLVVQAKLKKVKYNGGAETDPHWSEEIRAMIESLGKLAFEQLQKGTVTFPESDLKECGIDVTAASIYSGVFRQFSKEERGLYRNQKVKFRFVHLSVQEFVAALHVHLTFINSGVNLLSQQQSTTQTSETTTVKSAETQFYQNAVDQALESPDGHQDQFLSFLLGLSLQTNQSLLGLRTQTSSRSQTNQDTIQYIKKKLTGDLSAKRSINLLLCLNELKDSSLVDQIQESLRSGRLSTHELCPAQWSALVFILLSSEHLNEFDLKKYCASEEALLRLLPVVTASNKAVLSSCNLSRVSCEALSSALSSQASSLRDLGLSDNDLQDSGLKALSIGLESSYCRTRCLRLSSCNLTERSCEVLSSVVSRDSSSLRELDLSNNKLMDSGVKLLSVGLGRPHCKLEALSLSGCLVTGTGCASLASALSSNPSCLRELDLSRNHLGSSELKLLSAGLESPQWRLESLRTGHDDTQTLRTYFCPLAVDSNTVNMNIKLFDNNRTMAYVDHPLSYPHHPHRFANCAQLLCDAGLTGQCYWEVAWKGTVSVTLSYQDVKRKTESYDFKRGRVAGFWSLTCSDKGYCVWEGKTSTSVPSSSNSGRVAVFLDHPAGTLAFYEVSSDKLTLLHTIRTTFTAPLYPGFGFWDRTSGSSVHLCPLDAHQVPEV